jgi:hypothetical protein
LSTDHAFLALVVAGGSVVKTMYNYLTRIFDTRKSFTQNPRKDTRRMEQIVIRTKNSKTMRPLLRSALQRELNLLEQGMLRTRARMDEFEKKYGMSTEEFLHRFNPDDLGETLDFIEWYGETKMLASLDEQKKAIEGTSVS